MKCHILDFCAHCGVLLPKGLGLAPAPKCPTCGTSVAERSARFQGSFFNAEALGFFQLMYGDTMSKATEVEGEIAAEKGFYGND